MRPAARGRFSTVVIDRIPGTVSGMRYEERPGPPQLRHSVSRFWFLEVPRLRQFEKILPLPFVHVILNLSHPYSIYDRSGTPTTVDEAFISGIQSEYLVIESPPLIRHVGIELRPAGLGAVTRATGPDVAGRVRDARPLIPGLGALIEGLRSDLVRDDESLPRRALERVDDFLTSAEASIPDPVAEAAVTAIETSRSPQIADIAQQVGVSQRSLLERFRAATGATPKAYAQLWRFHRFVNELSRTAGRPNWASLAVDAGYYDQPHVIRAFRRFSGWTPEEYRRRVAEFGADAAHFVPLDDVRA